MTNFFRDPEAFETLKQKVLPKLLENRPSSQALRIWVPGCSTGEEAYSIAIIIQEYLEETKKNCCIKIFATDIDNGNIEKARLGIFPDGIVSDISPQRLEKFFTKQNKKQLRDQWYNRAEVFFKDTKNDYKNRNLGAAAQEYLCRLHMTYEDWNSAIRELDSLAVQFPEYTFASEAYFRIAAIYETQLNLPDSAEYYYGKQVELYPHAPISETAKEKINNL